MSFARKSALLSAATALTVTLAAPAAAHADAVDTLLAKLPAGQISCSQAKQYWTNSADYNQKKSQALAAANFHPRGGEIRDAIARADEAIARCGLGAGGNNAGYTTLADRSGSQADGTLLNFDLTSGNATSNAQLITCQPPNVRDRRAPSA